MGVSDRTMIAILGGAVGIILVYAIYRYRSQRSHFTRTCVTADTNCQFVRTPVDYAYKETTSIPEKIGMDFPHLMGDPRDKLQPLENNPINLIRDEDKLHHQELLWKQYENDWQGCGNGKPYIVNDEKTRFSLADVGDIWAERQLYDQRIGRYGDVGRHPARTEQTDITPEPFDQLYGGGNWLHNEIGD